MNVLCYFGTFSPFISSHMMIVSLAEKVLGFDKVLIIPTLDSYHWKDNIIPYDTRVEYIELTLKDEKLKAEVFVEENNDDVSYNYTYNVLKRIKYLGYNPSILIGSDNLLTLDKWFNYKKLLNEFLVYIVNRDISKKDFERKMENYNKEISSHPNVHYTCIEIFNLPSATEVRKMIAEKDWDNVSKHLSPSVLSKIKEEIK